MSKLTDWIIGWLSTFGLLVLLGWQSERDARITAQDEARSIEQAIQTSCPSREGYRVVASVGMDGEQWVRWCGYYRTVIESVRVQWEKAQ